MGRVKLKIMKLRNMNARQSTYAKRKHGIMKKAKELSILCDIDVVLLMFSPTGKASLCLGKNSIGEVIAKFAQLTPQERAKRSICLRLNRKLENLEALKKMFFKLDHDVDISEFLDRSTPTVEVLSEKVRFLRTQLSDIHTRLSCWTNLDNVDDLQQLEDSLRLSLAQISARKASIPQHQQQQLMSSECKNQTEIDIDFGMEMEQQLENFSWVRTTGENMNVPIKEENPNLQVHQMYRDITSSASSSLGNYSGLSTPKLETGSIPGIPADPSLQFGNPSFLNDQKLQKLAEWNLLGSPADYYFSQVLEASHKPQLGGNKYNWTSPETLPYVAIFDDPLYFWPSEK
ncbi:PREDICTED: agamous-like MADS-box protein AGL30 isoform X2 [Camelina sativa]|uniref:Agamous-like MADS-box protein AGL30 isoform X2 n=1 Tax=Camelina sativa TaxID=90675 RepID=A0ABM0SSR7_CAMSA|nr:PREDICTED: agamous-like MADS-box protein AGL30 isoform X2 [Camelina sativa]